MRLPPLLCLVLIALPGPSKAHAASAPAPDGVTPKPAGRPPRAAAGHRPSALEKDARAFLESTSALFQPVGKTASEAAWTAATDVTPEHTGARAGAEKAAAALFGSKLVIERCKAFLAREKELDPLTARQLHKLLLGAAENP